jgi:uncharacterized protein (TIGR02466 family)
MGRFLHLFPLSVYRDAIPLPNDYRESLVQAVLEMESPSVTKQPSHSAWLGDAAGHEFLFQHPRFTLLFQLIAQRVEAYVHDLGLDAQRIECSYQRAWATITRSGQRISEHAHEQSNISVAYYLQKPPGSGGLRFITYQHPNEIARGIFTPAKEELGLIRAPSLLTFNTVLIDPQESDVVIFPSKTLHATDPNETDGARISVSADVATMLRDSRGHETMMPHISQWRSFDRFRQAE